MSDDATTAATPVEVDGNRLTLLPDGPESREALLRLIDGAKTDLAVLYYIFDDDEAGVAVRDALVRALARGVRVRLAVDGFGAAGTPEEFFEPLIEAGGDFCRFHPHFGRRYLLRNHQKMAIADRGAAVIGGFNVATPYFDIERDDSWRDLGLLIEGAAVEHLSVYFDRLFEWIVHGKSTVRALGRILRELTQPEGAVRWILGGPTRRLSPYARQLSLDLGKAKRLDMIMGYFSPNRRMLNRVGRVAARGGARVVTAGKTDVPLSRMAAWATYGRLLRRGVEIAEYQPRALHAKLIVMDDVVYVGSGNFDMRSLYINLEVMLRIEDKAFADQARALIDDAVTDSRTITRDLYRRARGGWFAVVRWRFAYWLFASVDFSLSRRLTS